jgi:hypothetical protein
MVHLEAKRKDGSLKISDQHLGDGDLVSSMKSPCVSIG